MERTFVFEVKFIGATNFKGSRVRIKDKSDARGRSLLLSYDYSISSTVKQAAMYIQDKLGGKCVPCARGVYALFTPEGTSIDWDNLYKKGSK